MSPLIEITDPRVFDPATILIDVRAGANACERYLAGHLPNAILATLDDDLAQHPEDAAKGGRHPLPALKDFAATLGRWGITPESHVVVYDDRNAAMGGARLWWMLRSIGHTNVQVLNGGLKAATDEGLELSTDAYQPTATSPYPIPEQYSHTVDIEEVKKAAKADDRVVIDVREGARYLGHTEPLDLVAGHIPGAVNLFYSNSLSPEGKYLTSQALATLYKDAIGDIKPEDVIVHCGSGVTACHTLLGMEHAGIKGPKLYVGSWSEWSRNNLPIATEANGL
ncbi:MULTISPECIES: sulfurtransferase [unclassified Mucilaginibacter]|uniref:sulfurtransferase n=2 Tax=Pseudomonadati TaxID=3379134 RepID=UPI002AC8F91C|nr:MULTISPECIES: sulfurtransferase [unclassified Mucilaginibacter]MEB0248783.1 sulfurtransferase [Mucilaginibacter sp. 5B2]MEB0263511.1 sulfurtransferase [Mucilaginibacter sp. 10I4]MEB0278589.1 sulfurtransferase [Mucilaginibacter sp. 10B2]MEB0299299.1 sulfurtransferase [Mucilaginibacter sp. 5C4]WPX23456.1 sulfurtransferase [Mucilaginibacter sp. 5C4]